VLNVLDHYYKPYDANLHPALHTLPSLPTHPYQNPTQTLTPFINPNYFQQIIFTPPTTPSINILPHTYPHPNITHPHQILLTQIQHHPNILPSQQLPKPKNPTLKFIPITKHPQLQLHH
ncbi:aminotransferase class V-fold PLP-dependent enzyme, partial [Staphylococcus epidermidis]|uniref:aminotransferase class V-fold PLP-dependent enzyme n=1 Tax=Staphylococcus epidermidis TaxID=1282 RepID=UPI00119EC13F